MTCIASESCNAVQALGERIRPVMTVNKLDRCFLELMYDGEEAYNTYRRVIETANVIMATYADELLGDTQVPHLPAPPFFLNRPHMRKKVDYHVSRQLPRAPGTKCCTWAACFLALPTAGVMICRMTRQL